MGETVAARAPGAGAGRSGPVDGARGRCPPTPPGAGCGRPPSSGAPRTDAPASGQEDAVEPLDDEVLLVPPDALLVPDAAEDAAGFAAAGAVEDFPPERESVR